MTGEATRRVQGRVPEGRLRDKRLLKPEIVGDGIGEVRVEAAQQLHGSCREEDGVIIAVQQPLVAVSQCLQQRDDHVRMSALIAIVLCHTFHGLLFFLACASTPKPGHHTFLMRCFCS